MNLIQPPLPLQLKRYWVCWIFCLDLWFYWMFIHYFPVLKFKNSIFDFQIIMRSWFSRFSHDETLEYFIQFHCPLLSYIDNFSSNEILERWDAECIKILNMQIEWLHQRPHPPPPNPPNPTPSQRAKQCGNCRRELTVRTLTILTCEDLSIRWGCSI